MNQATMVRGAALWAALPAVAGMITDKVGVPVYRGAGASTDGKSITLPHLPDGNLTWDQVVKAIAYLYHEAAHILATSVEDWRRISTPLERAFMGVLEDIRIERFAQNHFPAARKYLADLVRQLTEAGLRGESPAFAILTDEMSEAEVLQWYSLYRLRHDVLAQTAIAPVLATAAQLVATKFPAGMLVRLDALLFEVTRCDSTRDTLDLTRAIIKMIEEEKEKEEQQEQQQQQPPQQQQQEAGGQQGAGAGEPDPAQTSSEAPGQVGQGGEGDGEGDAEGEGGDAQAQSAPSGSQAPGSKALGKLLAMGAGEVMQDVGDMLKQSLNVIAQQTGGGSSTSMPNAFKLPLGESQADLGALRAAMNAVRTRTLNWMSSAAQADQRHVRSGIMIDPASLHRAAVGGHIFVEEDEGVDLNAAISIVIDRSVSMRQTIGSAAGAALTTMLAFEVPGIKTAVSVFPVDGCVNGERQHNGVAVIKHWEESPRRLAKRIASLTTTGGTPMAEAVLFAAADILRRDETLKIVMVVTDGDPDNPAATRAVIEMARATGIRVVGLGIGTDPSEVFGERFAAPLFRIGELSGAMVRLIKAAMKEQ